ncbi:MAG TPA: hypothetical protein VG841_03575 [Caulobacterales bacterium]|nr:hypothetical protein [Caulobacterales bacterium]
MIDRAELMNIERGFWTGDADYYRAHVDTECLVAFTELAGVQTREFIAGQTSDPERWRDLEIEEKGFLTPSSDTALLSYEVRAKRANGEPYHALVSTAYVNRDGDWRMAFHQHTPLAAAH